MPSTTDNVGKRLLVNFIDEAAHSSPSARAVCQSVTIDSKSENRFLTYGNIANIINRLAKWLDECTPADNDSRTIGYLASSDIRHLLFTLAAVKVRAKALLLSPRNSAAMHRHVLEKANCSFLIFDAPFQKVAEELEHDAQMRTCAAPSLVECLRYGDNKEHYAYEETWDTAADDPFAIIHTTGSTGMPKPVLMPQSSIAAVDAHRLVSSLVGTKSVLEMLAEADMPFLGFPLFHTAGLLQCCFLLLSGCTLMLPNPNKPVSRHMVREMLKTSGVDAALLPPSVLDDVAQDGKLIQELSRCRYIMFGGGSIRTRTGDALSQRVRLINSIGSAECGSFVQFPVESEHWNCYHFSDELNGIQWRRLDPQPDKYEMIITRSDAASGFQAVFKNFSDLKEFETKDLFSKHETIRNYWVYEGRRDDVVVLSTGENLNPLNIESAICENPSIQGALVFGSGLPQPGLLIELDKSKELEQRVEDIKQQVMDVLRETYRRSPDFVRIPQGNIIFANRDKPFVRTPKGTVQRRHTLQLYQKEIDSLFEPSRGGFDDQHLSLDLSSEEAFAGSLVTAVARITDTDGLDTNSDFFEAGMNSQQAEMLIANVRDAIRKEPNRGLDEGRLNEDPIYSQTSAAKLASYMFRPSQASRDRQDPRLQAMSKMLDKYNSTLPRREKELQRQRNSQEHILLTGSTGFVGSHLLRALCRRASIKNITCINRKNPARSPSKATERMNGSPSSKEVQYLTADLSVKKLGLEEQTYAELMESVTTIVHCQWPVNFKQPLSFFENQIQGLVNLVRFVVASKQQPQIIFLSSISTVANWDHDSPVPETLHTPFEYAQTGYGESKLISSLLLHKAGELAGIRASICRLGQVAGPVHTEGAWPDRDWFPILLKSSKTIGYLPDSLGSQGHLDWIPVDIMSELLADLTQLELPSEELTSYYHFVNPNRATWESIIPAVLDELQGTCKLTTLSDWVKKLEQHAARPEGSDQPPPGVQLLDFYRSLEGRPLEMETQHTQKRIPSLGNISPVNEEWMRIWLRQLASQGSI